MITGPYPNSFRTLYTNATGRPTVTLGTVLTPAQNSYPAYASLSLTATKACYGMLVNINSGAGANRDILVKIGMDPAGGTSYSDFILHLLGSCASSTGAAFGGVTYYFPIYVPAGATFAGSASVNNATVGTVNLAIWLYTDPTRPENMCYGHKVDTIGATTASSSGTAVTSGTTSEGTWTSLGNSTQDNFFWQVGMGVNDGTMASLCYYLDLGADNNTTTPNFLIQDHVVITSNAEALSTHPAVRAIPTCGQPVKSGTTIYGRMQCSGTADSSLSMIAYGVG